MITALAIAAAIWVGLEVLLLAIYHGTGFRLTLTAHWRAEWRLLDWNWTAARNARNDEHDRRLFQTKLEDQGVAFEPLCFRFVVKRSRVIEAGHGPIVANDIERERELSKLRRRAAKKEA